MGLVTHAVLMELIHEVVEHVLVLVLMVWGVPALGQWGDRPTCQLGI